jgi:hypothetical protein
MDTQKHVGHAARREIKLPFVPRAPGTNAKGKTGLPEQCLVVGLFSLPTTAWIRTRMPG